MRFIPAYSSGLCPSRLALFHRDLRGAFQVIRQLFSKAAIRFTSGDPGPVTDSASIEDTLPHPFEIEQPATRNTPFIFNSPHSGRTYLKDFVEASRLELHGLRRSEDAFVEQLFAPVTEYGAPLMHAHFPRAYLDVNREPYELDPHLIEDQLPPYANTQSLRVVGGLGTIARVVAESEEIYQRPLNLTDVLERINQLYRPYHLALEGLMNASMADFGVAVLIDCHSMPSSPLFDSGNMRPDFVLGDRFSTSCNPELTRFVAGQLKSMGYVVAFNKPYAGGFITEHYGCPREGRHALQIEINRALYMDENTYARSGNFEALRRDIGRLAEVMIAMAPTLFDAPRAAAE